MTEHIAIDVAAVAARVHRDGRRARVSHLDMLALADFVVATLDDEPKCKASLAASVAVVLRGMDEWMAAEAFAQLAHDRGADDGEADVAAGEALCELANSLTTLKTVFELEFPNV